MSGAHTEALAAFVKLFPPNPFKHGRMLGRNPQTNRKECRTWENEPVQLQQVKDHLGVDGKSSSYRLGYLPGQVDSTTAGAIDLDGKDFPNGGLEAAKRSVLKACDELNLYAYPERSSSGQGWHVWLFTDKALSYQAMRDALQAITYRAGLPKVETYPMGANGKGRWIIMPYYSAFQGEAPYLGATYLEEVGGLTIPADELAVRVKPNAIGALQSLADLKKPEKTAKKEQTSVPCQPEARLSSEAIEVLLTAARSHAPSSRHDAIPAFLNLAHKSGRLADMVGGLKSPEVFGKWCADGSRTVEDWSEEIDRWAERVASGKEENRRGLTYLREVGFDLPATLDPTESGKEGKQPPAGTRVVGYALEDAQLWHDQGENAYLTATVGEHREHYRLPSRAARDYLQALYYNREGRALNGQAQGEAVALMQAIARREGKEYRTAVRLAHVDGFTYVDLGTLTWEAVEIGKGYWKVIKPHECPVRFTRPAGFLPLPEPVDGGNLGELGEFLNTDRHGLMMCTAWLLGAVSGISPYPLLALSGEQGTGKSTAASVLRNLLDPNQADRRRAPKEERDLFISAQNTHVLSYDNLSSVPAWLSDSLCVLSTGGAFTARTLYSDNEETILEAVRPVIMNGIPDLLARPDLAERALTVTLHRIPDDRRTPEKVFWARYERARGRLLGALLTALGCALKELEHTELERAPRLADFARLIVAGEAALPWSGGEFLRAYTQMQSEAAVTVLEGEPVAEALRAFIDDEGEWTGTVKKLLGILGEREYPDTRPPAAWPKNARALGASLRRLAPALSKTGYSVAPAGRSKEGERYTLSLKEGNESAPSSPHTPATSGTAKNTGEYSQGGVHPGAATYTQTGSAGVLQVQRVNIEATMYIPENAVSDVAGERSADGVCPNLSLRFEGDL